MNHRVVNLYDFDGTIYNGQSSVDFCIFCLLKSKRARKYILSNLKQYLDLRKNNMVLSLSTPSYFDFLCTISDIDSYVDEFWDKKKKDIKEWYKALHKESDVIITGAPRFLVEPISKELGVKNLIATEIDKHTGKVDGSFCFHEEKTKRFKSLFPETEVDSCYTDNIKHDTPILSLARNKYHVRGNKIIEL